MCPILLKNVAFKFTVKKTPNFLQLTLGFAFIVFKSFSYIVGFIEFNLEQVFSKTNPWAIDQEELVAGLIYKGVVCSTGPPFIFILMAWGF
jgi:hypothetical protein